MLLSGGLVVPKERAAIQNLSDWETAFVPLTYSPKPPSRDVDHAQLLIIIIYRLNLAPGVFDVSRELFEK